MSTDEQKADVVERLGESIEMMQDGYQKNLTETWHTHAMQQAAKDMSDAQTAITALRDLSDRLKLEAQGHAGEARCANSTIYEIYQVLTGATGEPGNWNGAEPARKYVAAQQATITALQERIKELEGALRNIAEGNLGDQPWQASYDRIREVAVRPLKDSGNGSEVAR
jgi:Lon protease-like protein